ncbi:MAG: hypothetical protein R3C70_17740 [Geminicoccaceae bacterium]
MSLKIPVYQRQQSAAGPVGIQGPRAAGNGFAEFGAALQTVSSEMHRAHMREQEEQERADRRARNARKNEAYADAVLWLDEDDAAAEKDAPAGAKGYLEGRKTAYEKHRTDLLAAFDNEEDRAELGLWLSRDATARLRTARDFESASVAKQQRLGAEKLGSSLGAMVQNDPSRIDEALETLPSAIGSMELGQASEPVIEELSGGIVESWVRGLVASDPAKARDVLTSDDPRLRFVTPATRSSQLSAARSELERRRREDETAQRLDRLERQNDIRGRLDDNTARLANGETPVDPVTRDETIAAYGPEKGADVWQEIRAQTGHARAMGSVAGRSPDEQARMLAAARPDPADEGYAAAQRRYTQLQDAVAADRKRLDADPAAYVTSTARPVAAAFAAAETPEDFGRAVSLSLAEQERLGVPPSKRRAAPKAAVENLARMIGETSSTRERAEMLASWSTSIREPGPRAALLADLEKAGLPEGLRFLQPTLEAGDMAKAGRMLTALEAAIDLKGDTKRDLDDALVDAEPDAFERSLAGLTGDARPLAEARERDGTRRRLAAARMQAGEDADEAVRKADEDLLAGGTRVTREGLGAFSVPAGADAYQVETGLERLREEIGDRVPPATLARLLDPAGELEGDMAERMAGELLDDFADEAAWIDHPDGGYGLLVTLMDGTRGFLPGEDDKPLRVTADEAIRAHDAGWARRIDDVLSGEFGP